MADYHTALDVFLVDTAEKETYVVACFALIEELAEHLDAGNNRLEVSAKTHDLNFVAYFHNAGFDTAGSNSTAAGDREHVLNRHQEGFVDIAGRQGNPGVDSVHELDDFLFPLGFAVEGAESRAADDRSVVAVIFVRRKKIAHFHFNEFEHFFVVDHVALVEEYNETGNVHLTGEKDVLAGLGHGTVGCGYHDDSAVHLCGTGYHVLNVVSVSGAVNVCVVTVGGFVFYVGGVDCDTTLFFLGCVVNLVE